MTCGLNRGRILDYLDNCVIHNPGCFFMDLQHGYFYTANSRISVFSDTKHWAIVFEKSGYANRSSRVELELNFFGCCLRNLDPGGAYHQFNYNSKYFPLVSAEALDAVSSGFELIDLTKASVDVRSSRVNLPQRIEDYGKWIPDIGTRTAPVGVTFADLGRYLAFEYEQLCRATATELRTCLRDSLSLVLQVDQWHHRAYSVYDSGGMKELVGDAPSSYETFPMLADVLVTGDTSRYMPTLAPNSHWTNWPQAGSL